MSVDVSPSSLFSMLKISRNIPMKALGFVVPVFSSWRWCSSKLCQSYKESTMARIPCASTAMRANGAAPSTVEVGGYKFYGISIAAVQTCICIPSLSLAFDAGKSPSGAVPMRYMAITHGHSDHVYGLPLHLATRNLQKLPAATYFAPAEIEADIRNLVDAVGRLEGSVFEIELVPLTPASDAIEVKRDWLLKAFRTNHTVPSLGYILYKRKKKLKTDFAGKTGRELARLRQSGVELEDHTLIPEIAFTGDTRLDAIAESEDCRNARILITELTFLDDICSPEQARKFGHIHIEEVIKRHDIFKDNSHVIFTHFSARYSSDFITEAIARLPYGLRQKCIPFGVSDTVP